MSDRPKILDLLVEAEDVAADHALVSGLLLMPPERQADIVSILLERGNDVGLNALPQLFDRLDRDAQSMVVANTCRLFGSLRANVRHTVSQARLNTVSIIRRSGNLRLAYLAAVAIRDASPSIRTEAATTLRHLADKHCVDYEETVGILREATGPGEALPPTVVQTLAMLREERRFLITALTEAINSYESHHQQVVLEAAMFFAGELENALFQPTAIRRGKLTHAMLDAFSRSPSPRLAGFAYIALCYPELRKRILATLATCRDTSFFTEFIRHHWLAKDPAIKKNLHAVRTIAWLGDGMDAAFSLPKDVAPLTPPWLMSLGLPPDQVVTVLRSFLLSDNPAASRAAAWALVKVKTPGSTLALEGARNHDQPAVRRIIERELRRRHRGRRTARRPARRDRPQAWTELLETTGITENFDDLWKRFGGIHPDQAAGGGRYALRYVPGCATQVRVKLLSSNFADRILAIQFAVTMGLTEAFKNELFAAANDANPEVRAVAMTALGHIGDATSRRILERGLQDENPAVQTCAIEALDHMAAPQRDEIILPKAQSQDANVRAAAIRSLLKLQLPQAPSLLVQMLHDPRVEHRCGALWVVDQLKLIAIASRIDEIATNDQDPRVVRIARHVVNRLRRSEQAAGRGKTERAKVAQS